MCLDRAQTVQILQRPDLMHFIFAALLYHIVSFRIYNILYDLALTSLHMYYMDHCINLISSDQFTL